MKYYQAQPSAEPTGHRFGLSMPEAIVGAPECTAGALLSLDMGMVRPELTGKPGLFLEVEPFIDWVDLQLHDDGTYTFLKMQPIGDEEKNSIKELCQMLDDAGEDTLKVLYEDDPIEDLALGQAVKLVELDEKSTTNPLVWMISETPDWLQHPHEPVMTPDWIYLGAVESDYYFGTIFAFFNPTTQVLRNVFQCT